MWTITEDHLSDSPEDSDNRTGQSGGFHTGTPIVVNKDTPGASRFHLLDDDRILYFSGWLTRDGDWESAMDYGMYDAGCTIIQDGQHHDVIS